MSAVYMCDSCGTMFSVNEKGWKEFSERIDSNESNPYNSNGSKLRHMGPCCASPIGQVRPKVGNTVTDLPELDK